MVLTSNILHIRPSSNLDYYKAYIWIPQCINKQTIINTVSLRILNPQTSALSSWSTLIPLTLLAMYLPHSFLLPPFSASCSSWYPLLPHFPGVPIHYCQQLLHVVSISPPNAVSMCVVHTHTHTTTHTYTHTHHCTHTHTHTRVSDIVVEGDTHHIFSNELSGVTVYIILFSPQLSLSYAEQRKKDLIKYQIIITWQRRHTRMRMRGRHHSGGG